MKDDKKNLYLSEYDKVNSITIGGEDIEIPNPCTPRDIVRIISKRVLDGLCPANKVIEVDVVFQPVIKMIDIEFKFNIEDVI